MSPSRIFVAVLLLVLGGLGLADAAGLIDAATLIGGWWPLVLIAWPLVDAIDDRRLPLARVLCLALGATLLATAQHWTSDLVAWALLAVFAGLAVLATAVLQRIRRAGRDMRPPALPGGVLS